MSRQPEPSRWRRLIARLRRPTNEEQSATVPTPEPEILVPEEESWLQALITAVGEQERLAEVASHEFWRRVDTLWNRGDELLAAQWITKFIETPATDGAVVVELRARLIDMFERRGDLGPVVEHLEALCESPEHALRCHYLLAEYHRRRGDEVRALRHYESVLARDVDYPNVQQRVARIRSARGRDPAAVAGATLADAEAIGQSAGSRYILVRELGRGAFGAVFLARDKQLERDVAVKLLHPHLAESKRREACARFFSEARLAASLRHPNIVAILDLDEASRRIVMELATGGTLRALLKARGPRPLRRALERHAQILSALDAAHARGIIHRDLKPANLMFRRDPDEPGAEIILGDFGVAHLPDPDSDSGTPDNADGPPPGSRRVRRPTARDAVGTLAYMAPEQRRGQAISASDIYASAVVLFEMLTGQHPWPRDRLLSGQRSVGDFALPPDLVAGHAALVAGVQSHLERIGHPDAAARPTTRNALSEARKLRDEAMALGL